jgi:tetratricopeptide (TPR) repeat protein
VRRRPAHVQICEFVHMAKAARKPTDAQLRALIEAQDLIFDAWGASTAKRRIQLAKKAIAVSPLCASAHALLARHAVPDSDEALGHWQRALEAGKEAIGTDFEEFRGEFWGWSETRPYMEARIGLAYALWLRGERLEAIGHAEEMLELNPNDNQGIRHILAGWLIDAGEDEKLGKLLARYHKDNMANWAWTKALAAFRRDGDSAATRKLLAGAVKSNAHVADYLLGREALPKTMPPYHGFGDKDEAVLYADQFGDGWTATPGAIAWLEVHSPATRKKSASRKKAA